MHCPKCGYKDWRGTCPQCGFEGEPELVELLSNLSFLLAQLATWQEIPEREREGLRRRYGLWRRQIEVELGLRQPPLDAQSARAARVELAQIRALLNEALPDWVSQGWVSAPVARQVELDARKRAEHLANRLLDAPPTPSPRPAQRLLSQAHFMRQVADKLHASGRLADPEAYPSLSAELNARVESLEIDLGLRPRPAPEPRPPKLAPRPAVSPQPSTPARPPRQPLTWERVWETLLSERTLNALLFLGVFLLFTAAVSLVVWNWEALPPWLQVIFMALFTAIFYVLGWYVRVRLKLQGSGIALSAVASLLVPLDFYAFYLSGGFPPERWAEVWLVASAVCLGGYTLTAYLVQAEFFGYLVGGAAGSLLSAGMQLAGWDQELWQAGWMALALGLALVAERLYRERGRWQVLATPLGHVALVAATTVPLLALGWALTGRAEGGAFGLALAADWWLAGLVFSLATGRYRLRALALAAALCFPVAVWATERALWDWRGIEMARYALGWAGLVPAYLVAGRRLMGSDQRADPVRYAYGQTAVGVGAALILLAALWPLVNLPVAVGVHLILAVTLALAARLWQQPRLLALTSLLLLSAVTAWVVSVGMTVTHLGLAWSLLAILHLIAAQSLGSARARYDGALYGAGWLLAGLALLPPLSASNRPVLTYTLGNWMALNAWLAYLARADEAPGLGELLAARGWSPLLFHWAAALPLPAWLWLLWGESWPPASRTLAWGGYRLEIRPEWVYLLAAWGLLMLGRRLGRRRWAYAKPWQAVAQLSNLIAWALPLLFYQQPWAALGLLLAAGFYFASVPLTRCRWWLVAGGLAFAAGWGLGLDWLGLSFGPLSLALASMLVVYSLIGWWLSRRWGPREDALFLWHALTQLGALVVFGWSLTPVLQGEASDAALLWVAAAQLALGACFGVHAWFLDDAQLYGHVAAWLGVIAGALVAMAYSQGRGSSAAKAALLAAGYVLAERGLYRAALARWRRLSWRRFFRRAWHLYRRPLLGAGWAVSAGAIGLALVRNLVILGGGPGRESWSVVGLLLVTGLYAWGAWLFRRQRRVAYRLVWLASLLVVLPWTLLTHLGWYVGGAPPAPRYALAWGVLALLELLLGAALTGARQIAGGRWGRPLAVVAHLLLPLALLWGAADVDTSSLTMGLGLLFYLIGLGLDRWRQPAPARARFLYPAAGLLPLWAIYLLARFFPAAPQTSYGLLVLGFALPALFVGRWLARREPAYRWPLYWVAYGAALIGTALVAHQRPVLIGALLFDAALALLSAGLFAEPWWLYPASALLPAALWLALLEGGVPFSRHGWALIGLGALYLGLGWGLRRARAYATPWLSAAFALIALGLPPSSQDRLGAWVGYGGAAWLYGLAAWAMCQPLLLTPAVVVALVPYWVTLLELGLARIDRGLALWPGILLALLTAHLVDRRWGVLADGRERAIEPFPWSRPSAWAWAAAERLTRWWALPWYAAAYGGAAVAALLSWQDAARLTGTLALAACLYGLATLRFRLRGWLLLSAVTAQLAALSAIDWLGWMAPSLGQGWAFLAFTPVTWATALAGLALQRYLGEGPPLPDRQMAARGVGQVWRTGLRGWSRPLYWLVAVDLCLSQALTLKLSGQSAGVALSHALLLGLLATVWRAELLAYAPPLLGLLALGQDFVWRGVGGLVWPVALAVLALAYGLLSCGLRYLRRRGEPPPEGARLWERPLWLSGWLTSALSINLAVLTGIDVPAFVGQALFDWGEALRVQTPQVQMVVAVTAILGLLYLAYALTDRHLWLSYAAVGLLLGAWCLEWLLVWGLREVQWYAVPAGGYLLGVGYLEWRYGKRSLARWIDRAGLFLLLGSAFWQSLGPDGWAYALLMGAEGLGLVWWGSARRLRRFLYAGVVGVVLGVSGQLLEPLLSANVIVLALVGLSLILVATLVERRLETVRLMSRELRERLEAWE